MGKAMLRKILIVDDNPLIRMGLTEMIEWGRLGLKSVGCVEDGEEALELCREMRPDIVITDIRMPRKDGIELLTRLQEDYPEVQTIVVSAYDTFSYVKHAMVTGSLNYILKPIDPGELNATIEKALMEIEKRKKQRKNPAEILLEQIRWAYGENYGKEEICLIAGKGYHAERTEFCRQMLRNAVVAENAFPEDIFLAAGLAKGGFKNAEFEEKWNMFLKRGAMGRKILQPVFSENEWVKGCQEAIADAFLQGFCWKGVECEEHFSEGISQGNLFPLLDSGNLQLAYCLLTDSLSACERWEKDKCEKNQEIIRACLKIMCQYSEEIFDASGAILSKMDESRHFLLYEDVREILKDIYRVMERICLNAAEKLHTQKNIAIQMKKILDENFKEDISIEKMAELFGYSAVYLSRLFKRETGVSAGQYLIGIRMEKAAELLRKTDMKIIDVAHQVGYGDELHFQKLFKKKTGKTPGAYRKDTG